MPRRARASRLLNLGFKAENIHSLDCRARRFRLLTVEFEIERFADSPPPAHCFFEWIYFANVASTLDDRSVYLSRTALGDELARLEDPSAKFRRDTIVVPVPDTSKAAADSMAYQLGFPSGEGLIRNRYSGRTFIEGSENRVRKAEASTLRFVKCWMGSACCSWRIRLFVRPR